MGAIFGLIGEGSLQEVEAMGRYMPHRGFGLKTWSPARDVYLGTRGPTGLSGENVAVDAQLDDRARVNLRSLLARGVERLREVHGYFSLAFYDSAHRELVLACDTSGFKSLYYVRLPGRIAFASEYKALLALSDFQCELDRDAGQYYLATRSFRMDRPLMARVKPVKAGAAVTIAADLAVRARSYWVPVPRPSNASPERLAAQIRTTLERVVARQVGGFSRVAVTLSAGLDSACVLALLRHVRPELRIDSYTIGYGPDDPECVGGRELASLFGTVHHEVVFDPEHLPEGLPGLVWLMEDCAGREEALLQHLVLGEASRSAPVVFGGYGADVLFAGMPRYRLIRMRELWPRFATPLREVFQFTQTGMYPGTWLGGLGARLLYGNGTFPPPAVVAANGPARVRDDMSLDAFIADQLCEAQDSGYIEVSLEAGGAEFRDPFQATEVMDLALTIPGRLNVGLWQQKRLLRRAMADLLPGSIRARGKSLQRVRHDLAISRALDEMCDRYLTTEAIEARGLIGPAYLRDLRSRLPHEPYTSERLYRLWTLVCLELWQRQFVDAKGRLRDPARPEAADAPILSPAELQTLLTSVNAQLDAGALSASSEAAGRT